MAPPRSNAVRREEVAFARPLSRPFFPPQPHNLPPSAATSSSPDQSGPRLLSSATETAGTVPGGAGGGRGGEARGWHRGGAGGAKDARGAGGRRGRSDGNPWKVIGSLGGGWRCPGLLRGGSRDPGQAISAEIPRKALGELWASINSVCQPSGNRALKCSCYSPECLEPALGKQGSAGEGCFLLPGSPRERFGGSRRAGAGGGHLATERGPPAGPAA